VPTGAGLSRALASSASADAALAPLQLPLLHAIPLDVHLLRATIQQLQGTVGLLAAQRRAAAQQVGWLRQAAAAAQLHPRGFAGAVLRTARMMRTAEGLLAQPRVRGIGHALESGDAALADCHRAAGVAGAAAAELPPSQAPLANPDHFIARLEPACRRFAQLMAGCESSGATASGAVSTSARLGEGSEKLDAADDTSAAQCAVKSAADSSTSSAFPGAAAFTASAFLAVPSPVAVVPVHPLPPSLLYSLRDWTLLRDAAADVLAAEAGDVSHRDDDDGDEEKAF
jgi:hypothetical protein